MTSTCSNIRSHQSVSKWSTDFSLPYYTSAMAVLTTQKVIDGGAEPTASLDSLKEPQMGCSDANNDSYSDALTNVDPTVESDPLLYNDNADVTCGDAWRGRLMQRFVRSANGTLSLCRCGGGWRDCWVSSMRHNQSLPIPISSALLIELTAIPLKECVDAAISELTESPARTGRRSKRKWLAGSHRRSGDQVNDADVVETDASAEKTPPPRRHVDAKSTKAGVRRRSPTGLPLISTLMRCDGGRCRAGPARTGMGGGSRSAFFNGRGVRGKTFPGLLEALS